MIRAGLAAALSLALAAATHGQTTLTAWRHEADRAEVAANLAAVERFNASQDRWRIKMVQLPQGSYNQSVTAAALAGRLPCVLEVDQPLTPSFAWAGHLRPLKALLSPQSFDGLLPSALGLFRGTVYSIGQFDAAVALYARRSALEAVGARIPTIDRPWTRDELDTVLADLKARRPDAYPIDMQTAAAGEWYTYAYGALLHSFGGGLIDRDTMLTAEGVLNGPAAARWGRWFQGLFDQGYANPRPPDQKAFAQGRSDLAYGGNWLLNEFRAAWGEDLLILPPADFGEGPVIGGGSWQWGVTTACAHPEGAAAFIDFLMTDREIAAMADATGLAPVREGAAALTEDYKQGGPRRVFYEFASRFARKRPETPAYPFMSNAFEKAARNIRDGMVPLDALDDAVDVIEQNIEDNRGYGFAPEEEA